MAVQQPGHYFRRMAESFLATETLLDAVRKRNEYLNLEHRSLHDFQTQLLIGEKI